MAISREFVQWIRTAKGTHPRPHSNTPAFAKTECQLQRAVQSPRRVELFGSEIVFSSEMKSGYTDFGAAFGLNSVPFLERMANKYFQPGEQRAAKVEDLFAAIAPRYDLINDLQSFGLHRLWKRRMIRMAGVHAGDRALDLCCGTGDVSFALTQAGAVVTGLDFSEPMLQVARQRAETAKLGENPVFIRGDAQNLPFEDQSFDVVTISYGLRNLSNFERGLEEMWRVLRPGGRLLVLDFGKPDNRVLRWLYFSYLRWFVPVFGRIFCGDSSTHAYILESLKNYPAQRGVEAKMRALKCAEVRVCNLLGGAMSINYGRKM